MCARIVICRDASGRTLTFFTIDNPMSELSDEQLRWHMEKAIDLSRCSLSSELAEGSSDNGLTVSLVGAHLPSGATAMRFDTKDDAHAW